MANPKTADPDREMQAYLEKMKELLRAQQEKAQQSAPNRTFSVPSINSTPIWHANPGISHGDIRRSLEPPKPDPHVALASQIEKLKAAEPVKIGKRMPDYCHTITAYRGWAVKNEQLTALGQSDIWKPKTAKPAKCSSQGKAHRAPSKECSCGYWSFRTMDLLTEALRNYREVTVVGAVEIWGRVIECDNGYRSEFAYPQELWLLKPDMEYLSWTYGVPVRTT
jgi:hypothetical protein